MTYESDLDEARGVMERAARDAPGVIEVGPDIRIGAARYPASPTCYVETYADHGVRLTLRYWVREPYHLQRVRSTVNERIRDGLAEADVDIAYPHAHLMFDETSGELPVDLRDRRER